MTQTRKWTFATIALVALILVGSWFLLIGPQRAQASDLSDQTAAVTASNDQLEVEIATLKQQQKQLPKWQAQLAQLREQLPASPALPGLIRDLSDVAHRAGVDLTSLTPAAPVTMGPAVVAPTTPGGTVGLQPGVLASLDVQLTASGGYFEIQRFVNNLERMQRSFLVVGVSITEDDAAAAEDGAPEGTLTATVSGRVFLVPPVDAAGTTTTTTTTTTGTVPAGQ